MSYDDWDYDFDKAREDHIQEVFQNESQVLRDQQARRSRNEQFVYRPAHSSRATKKSNNIIVRFLRMIAAIIVFCINTITFISIIIVVAALVIAFTG